MNQILIQKNTPILVENSPNLSYFDSFNKRKKYILRFFVSIIAIIILFLELLSIFIRNKQAEQISKQLLHNYNITTLYGDNENLNVSKSNVENAITNPFVIGLIKIESINLNYPILSESNQELLKISVCRFAGPMPNEIGNLCIAGHNFVDNNFFAHINKLVPNSLISIFDLSGTEVVYEVYDKYEVFPNDFSCTSQEVGNKRILTLVTCNNVNGKRTIIKAREIL